MVGPYRLLEEIGHGGMGTVWLAERSDEAYTKRVAIKLMQRGLHSTELLARFKTERQILASLDHPHIARLIDGGTTENGVPYVVMEHVEGKPLDLHCDEERLTTGQRLELFSQVCEAVSFAHRHLVVHRDLKPANIMVTAKGEPKLLDFGIAKLLDPENAGHTVAETATSARLLTPEYASPEQVRGEPISVATDVYALGVLLYRLMTGRSPYGVSTEVPREYEAAILDNEPLRPSTVVTSPDTDPAVVTSRSTSPQKLQRRLVGDLDNIVLHALQKEAERRYATVNELSTDIGRYLAHLPVVARGDDWLYKARKFLVRNARSLAITTMVVVSIAALTAVNLHPGTWALTPARCSVPPITRRWAGA